MWTLGMEQGYDSVMASDFIANSCGGARWRTLPGGLIEVEGQGVPMYTPSDPHFKLMTQTWSHFSAELAGAASKYGIPVSWALAVASVETGFLSSDYQAQARAVSPVGAVGVMQLMPQYFTKYSREELLNPSINIPVGVEFLNKLCRSSACPWRCELPYLGSVYNAGSGSGCVQCSPGKNIFNFAEDANYSLALVLYNNAALTYLQLSSPAWPWMIAGGLVAAAAAWVFFPEIERLTRV